MKKLIILFLLVILITFIITSINNYENESHYLKHKGSINHIVAHRGYSSLEYENSLESIILANESDCVDAIEVDVRMTNDGFLVLSHNNKIKTQISKTKISDMTYDEFMNVKLTRETVLQNKNEIMINENFLSSTATDIFNVLNIVETKTLILDIKYGKKIKTLNKKLLKLIEYNDNIIIQSSNINGLKDLIYRNNKIKYQYVIDEPGDFYNVIDEFYGVAIRHNLVNYANVDYLINKGLKVFIWTINDTKTYEKIISETKEYSNEIFYITDYPNILCSFDIKKFIKI